MSLVLVVLALATPTLVPASAQGNELGGKRIYFAESNREVSPFDRSELGLSRLTGLLQMLGADVMPLDWRRDIPEDADLVIIAGATRRFEVGQTARLWAYLGNGGSVLVISDPLTTTEDDEEGTLTDLNTSFESRRGLFELTWPDFGIRGRDDVILIDSVDQLEETTSLTGPDLDTPSIITRFSASELVSSHPINTGIDGSLEFFGARSIEYDASIQSFRATPLIFAPDDTYGETEYEDYLLTGFIPTYSASADTNRHTLAIAAASENPTTNARVVVLGDLEFAINGGGFETDPPNSATFLYPNNVLFLVNAVAWLVHAEPVDASVLLSGYVTAPARTPVTLTSPPDATEALETGDLDDGSNIQPTEDAPTSTFPRPTAQQSDPEATDATTDTDE